LGTSSLKEKEDIVGDRVIWVCSNILGETMAGDLFARGVASCFAKRGDTVET
jgi:hypothetical protein